MLERKIVENDIYILSKSFALRVVRLYKYLTDEHKEYVLSKQLLRSGTSIGANVHEGKNGQSRADFCSKMNIALKEATESNYWIDIELGEDITYSYKITKGVARNQNATFLLKGILNPSRI